MSATSTVSFLRDDCEINPGQVLCGLRGVTASLADMDAADVQDDKSMQRKANLHSAAAVPAGLLADRIA